VLLKGLFSILEGIFQAKTTKGTTENLHTAYKEGLPFCAILSIQPSKYNVRTHSTQCTEHAFNGQLSTDMFNKCREVFYIVHWEAFVSWKLLQENASHYMVT